EHHALGDVAAGIAVGLALHADVHAAGAHAAHDGVELGVELALVARGVRLVGATRGGDAVEHLLVVARGGAVAEADDVHRVARGVGGGRGVLGVGVVEAVEVGATRARVAGAAGDRAAAGGAVEAGVA